MIRRFVFAAALLLGAARPVRAQDYAYGGGYMDMASSMVTQYIYSYANGTVKAGKATRPAAPARPAARPVSLTYPLTPALQTQTVQRFAANLRAKNPAQAQQFLGVFGPGKYEYATLYQKFIQGTGLRENDAADAMTAYLLLGHKIVGDQRTATLAAPAQATGLRRQFAAPLSQNPRLTAPGKAAQAGEEFKLLTILLQAGWEGAAKNGQVATFRQRVATAFRQRYGLDFAKLTLTDEGFVTK